MYSIIDFIGVCLFGGGVVCKLGGLYVVFVYGDLILLCVLLCSLCLCINIILFVY